MRTETYDYVICGAGSAGCVLANRLSVEPGVRVLVLEAGPMDRDLMIHIPAGVYAVYTDPKLNWSYETEDEPELNGPKRVYATRQGRRRFVVDQLHGLHARPSQGLRSLGQRVRAPEMDLRPVPALFQGR